MFGKGFTQHFMYPYAQKFWGINPNELTTDWVNVRHPRPSLEDVLTGALTDQTKGFGVNAIFRYPKENGYGDIAIKLSQKLKDRISYNKLAINIDTNSKTVYFKDGDIVKYENLYSTLPLTKILDLLTDVPPEISRAAQLLISNTFQLVFIGIDKPNITTKSWIYFSDNDIPFVRVSFPGNMSENCVPPGCSSILVEISYGPNEAIPNNINSLIPKVIEYLIKVDDIFLEVKH